MKQLFACPVKVEKRVEMVDNVRLRDDVKDSNEIQVDPFEGWYDEKPPEDQSELFSTEEFYSEGHEGKSQIEVEIKNTDHFKQYAFDTDYLVTLKAARMSKEATTPFVVIKTGDKKSKATELDTIYRTDKKIKYSEYKQGIRLGFIRVSDSFRYARYNMEKTQQLVGVVNDEIPIRRKKGFNQKRVGYIKLTEGTGTEDYYVEATKSRGYLWMILMVLVMAALVVLLSGHDWDGWHFNWDGLTAYKTSITEVQEQNQLSINHEADAELVDGLISLGLTSDGEADLQFKVKIYCGAIEESNLIYESDKIMAGAGLEKIEPHGLNDLRAGNYTCAIICEVYKDTGSFIGTLESHFILKV